MARQTNTTAKISTLALLTQLVLPPQETLIGQCTDIFISTVPYSMGYWNVAQLEKTLYGKNLQDEEDPPG